MQSLRSQVLFACALIALVASSSGAVTPKSDAFLEFPLAFEASPPVTARAADLGPGWIVQRNSRTGFIHAAYGGSVFLTDDVATPENAAELARAFLLLHADRLGIHENLELRNVNHARGKWVVHYRQVIGGIPVHRASAFVLMGDSGRVMAFGSDFHPEGEGLAAIPALSESEAVAAAVRAIGSTARADRPAKADLFFVPAASGETYELRLAYRTVFESNEPFGKWVSFVDAGSGEILSRQNDYRTANVVGTVEGDVQAQPPTYSYCDGSALEPMANLTVEVQGGASDVTDASGGFDISHGGTAPVTITAELLGPYVNVNRYSGLGPDASFSGAATPGTPYPIMWSAPNSRQDERDTFYHTNLAHDFVQGLDWLFVELDYAMPTMVGRTDFYCPGNAWWDGTGINFCSESSTYGNTGEMGNVVYHEYGHGVTQEVYLKHASPEPPSDVHEGNSDIIANFLDRNSVIGFGFYLDNCTGGIRDADNSLQWPQDNDGGHYGGQIIAGFQWDAWQSLLAVLPQAEADAIAFNNWHFARDMGTPQSQPDQVLWTFMMDDDDANLGNGTPNYDHYCLGASNHGFECPEILVGVIITHDRIAHTEDGSQGFDAVATIVSTEGALDPASLILSYRRNGGPFFDLTMTPTGNPDEYGVHVPSMDQFSEVEYFLSAEDMFGNSRTDPPLAPAQLHGFDVAYFYDDLESGFSGWTAGLPGDDATTGQWEAVDPIGTAAQPEDDSTPDAGVIAFITGQCSGPNCSGGCTLGCNDIDGGATTLLSPVYDLSGTVAAKIKYDFWYSNNTGNNPNNDTWTVDVSNDGGGTWTNVVSTMASNGSWESHGVDLDALFGAANQVQLRFIASDLGSGSLVEAGIDEIRLLADFGGGVDVDETAYAQSVAFALTQNQPNPFRPSTRIEYSVPERSEVELAVYNVRGQVVRVLAQGVREVGRYRVAWDGQDSSGRPVAAGVYFSRLTANSGVITRKMTLLK